MLGIRIKKRETPLRFGALIIIPCALLVAFLFCSFLLLVQGKPPIKAFYTLILGGFGDRFALEDTLIKAIPLFLCSLGVSIAFRMKIFNIGAEGQFALGGVGATWAVLMFPGLPMYFMLPLMLLCAAMAGGIWGCLPGALKVKFGLNEIISTLMLNYIGIEFLRYLIYGPWKDPGSMGFPMTAIFPPNATFPTLFGPTFFGRTHAGLIVCLLAAATLAIFLHRTRLGFELKASGESARVSKFAHMPYGFLLVLVLTMSGALAGMAGCVEVSATFNRLQPNLPTGYGYTAIVVAWLSRLRISSIAFFAFFLAGLKVGGEIIQMEMRVPAAFGGILEGLILLCVLAGQFFYTYKLEFCSPIGQNPSAQTRPEVSQ